MVSYVPHTGHISKPPLLTLINSATAIMSKMGTSENRQSDGYNAPDCTRKKLISKNMLSAMHQHMARLTSPSVCVCSGPYQVFTLKIAYVTVVAATTTREGKPLELSLPFMDRARGGCEMEGRLRWQKRFRV
jgi:hypothetical protein